MRLAVGEKATGTLGGLGAAMSLGRMAHRPTPAALCCVCQCLGVSDGDSPSPSCIGGFVLCPTRPETQHLPFSNFLLFAAGLVVRPVWGDDAWV